MFLFDLDPGSYPQSIRDVHGPGKTQPVSAGPARIVNLSRRGFLKLSGAAAGSVFVLGVFGCSPVDEGPDYTTKVVPSGPLSEADFQPNAWVAINQAGDVFIVNPRAEMGQGIKTGVGQVIADEMDADWSRVHISQADGHPRYGDQNTGGSRSVRLFFDDYRRAGAAARAMLIAAAAAEWDVDATECDTRLHDVHHEATGRSLAFAELAVAAAALQVPEEPSFKSRERWRYIGKEVPAVDANDIVTGAAAYGADIRFDGMKYAVVARPPVLGGDVADLDDSAARAVAGVIDVIQLPRYQGGPAYQAVGGVAVVAENTWAAIQGREALEIEWDHGPNAVYDSEAYAEQLVESASNPGRVVREQGDPDGAFESAAQVLEATYSTAMLAHAPIAPPVSTAWVKDDGTCEVWAPSQAPQAVRMSVAQAVGLAPDQVTVHATLLGGAFGRKGKADYSVEAAMVSQRAGVPVQLFWTREDALRHCYYHAPSGQVLRAALDENGRVTAWHHRSAYPAIASTFSEGVEYGEGEMSLGASSVLWDVPNMRVENCRAPAHIRIGWLRSVTNIHHGFAVGAFVGDIAHATGRDQKQVFLELLGPDRDVTELFNGDNGPYGEPRDTHMITSARLRQVIERVCEGAGWGRELPEGHGLGLAAHYSFWGYAAYVVHAAVDGSRVTVHRVDAALDCGTIVNPDRVKAQMEGAVSMSLTHALHSEIVVRNGAVVTGNYDDYPLLRLRESPETHVHLIDSTAPPGGVGEPGIPPMMPALANAILAATGTPVRKLPIQLA